MPEIEERQTNMLDQTVCVSLTLNRIGTRRKVSTTQVEVNTDKKMLHVSKEIFRSEEFKRITSLDAEIRGFLAETTLPATQLFRGGVYLIPIPLVAMVDARLEDYRAERQRRVDAFLAAYPQLIESAREHLKDLYNPNDYPPIEQVRAEFGMSTQYMSLGVPEVLEGISKSIFKRESAAAAAKVASAAEEIKAAMRDSLKQLVDHMVERLTPKDGETEGPKKFHYTLVTNLQQYLDVFDAKNITGDTELAELVGQCRALLNGVDPKKLRENGDVREYVKGGFEKIQGQLGSMVVEQGRLFLDDAGDEESGEAAASAA